MHSLEALELYTQFHARWFEGVGNHIPDGEYLDAVSHHFPESWKIERTGLWYSANPPGVMLPEHGWKLHVSVCTRDSLRALRKAAPILKEESAAFKFLLDRRITALVNGKLWPRGASGKFITIFPVSLDQFHRLGNRLSQELSEFTGPYILSDRRWPGSKSVYYRYGGIVPRTLLQADGTRRHVLASPNGEMTPDARTPYWNPPEWARDPFDEAEEPGAPAVRALADGRFAIHAALSFSNRGGVYRAVDRETGKEVVLKEARPHVELGTSHVEAIAALEKEYRLLRRLANTGYFVRPIVLFHAWEHAYLAEEFVPGAHLGLFSIRNHPIYSGNVSTETVRAYFDRMRSLWLQLACAIAAAHALGIVLGDLSFTNVLVKEDGEIRICDLETAMEEGIDAPTGLHTPGMSAADMGDRANDYYSLGALIFGSIFLAHGLTGFYAPARRRFLADLTVDLGVPAELPALIDNLMERPESCSDDPRTTVKSIERLPFGVPAAFRTPRLGLEIERRFDSQRRAELDVRVRDAVSGVTRYLRGTADTSRTDRLFPADLFVFETNPLSVAFGSLGVLYSLHRLTGTVPASLIEWVLRHKVTNEEYPPGLYVGQAGIAWVLSELGYEDRALQTMRTARKHDGLWDSASVLFGAAGYGLCCLKLWLKGAGEEFLDEAVRAGRRLEESCVRDNRGVRWPNENGSVYLGYAHGGSGIALFLLYLSLATSDRGTHDLGREALRFELAQGVWLDGEFAGFPSAVTEGSEPPTEASALSCYWDTGSAGVGTALVRYFANAPEASDRKWLECLAADASRKYTAFPQLFRGLAGLGNFLLDVWQQTRDEKHLLAAWQAAEGVLLFAIDREEGLAFPGDQARRESADYATGAAGAGLFLDRLRRAEQEDPPNFNFVLDELLPLGSAGRASALSISAGVKIDQ